MNKITIGQLVANYKNGQRFFIDLEFEDGTDLSELDLHDTIFDSCYFCDADFTVADLSGCRFIGCSLKCSSFISTNLSGAGMINCAVDGMVFQDAVMAGFVFENNSAYGHILGQNDIDSFLQANH